MTPARARWANTGDEGCSSPRPQRSRCCCFLGEGWGRRHVLAQGHDYFLGQLPGFDASRAPGESGESNCLQTAAAMRSHSNLVTLALALAGRVGAAEYNSFDGPGFPTCYDVTAVHNATSVDESEFETFWVDPAAHFRDLPERC